MAKVFKIGILMSMSVQEIIRPNTVIEDIHDYYCTTDKGLWGVVNSKALKDALTQEPVPVMSLRLATGLIGELNCPAGNKGPKGTNEVLVGIGELGIQVLLTLGALPCTVCKSGESLLRMSQEVKSVTIQNTGSEANALDANWLHSHYDARRLNWSELTKLKIAPSRFYTRPRLDSAEVEAIESIFNSNGLPVPAIGFYDVAKVDKFTKYIK